MIIRDASLVKCDADIQIAHCLNSKLSFSVVAGAGSGKTTSLVNALDYVRKEKGNTLRRDSQQIACITYTNRAVEVISSRLGWDELFHVSTLHRFLWDQIKHFHSNIRKALQQSLIPKQIAKKREDDNGGDSQKAIAAREKISNLLIDISALNSIERFTYGDSQFSDYQKGELGHDDIIELAAYLILEHAPLRRMIGQQYPYIFVDEAQDTFVNIIEAINKICELDGLPVVGYFGDPMQQIYDKRAGDFSGPVGSLKITKEENFRCSPEVIFLLNAFRNDVTQYPAGANKNINGSVELLLIEAEKPMGPRNRYTEEQLIRASSRFDNALETWGWSQRKDIKLLFLVRQMIARRAGFIELHKLFTGDYASSKAQDDYESGTHRLLKPFIDVIWPLVEAFRSGQMNVVLDLLMNYSPAFAENDINANLKLREIKLLAKESVQTLSALWDESTTREILIFCHEKGLCSLSERIYEALTRKPMTAEYNKEQDSENKGDWLAESFFQMKTKELENYSDFINENTPYSTQHGVKGEEYPDVVVVFDDVEAAWNHYSFAKTLTPSSSGIPIDTQLERSKKLIYVCFSRAEVNLKIILFTPKPNEAKQELELLGLFSSAQINIKRLT